MIPLSELSVIVPAAGASRRMPDENKLLKPYRDRPLLMHALETARGAGLGEVILVTRTGQDQIADLGAAAGARTIVNPDADSGMGESIAAGARRLSRETRGVFILPGDMPLIRREDFISMASALPENDPLAICAPVHKGRRGHPVLFAHGHFAELARLIGDAGGRGIIAAHSDRLIEVPVASDRIFIDFDTLADFSRDEDPHS